MKESQVMNEMENQMVKRSIDFYHFEVVVY